MNTLVNVMLKKKSKALHEQPSHIGLHCWVTIDTIKLNFIKNSHVKEGEANNM